MKKPFRYFEINTLKCDQIFPFKIKFIYRRKHTVFLTKKVYLLQFMKMLTIFAHYAQKRQAGIRQNFLLLKQREHDKSEKSKDY
jgi:hypothetical protein